MKLFLVSFMWIAGLLIAGSDNLNMPWVNILGLILFAFASLILAKHDWKGLG